MSQATTLPDLYDMLLGEVSGCPPVLVLQHLQQALRKFCEDSEAFTEKMTAINLVAEQVDYTLAPAHTSCEIRRIAEVWIRTSTDVTDGLDGTLQDFDKYEFDPVTKVLTLDDTIEPQEAVTSGLVVKVVLVPFLKTDLHATTAISAAFLNLWAETVLARACYTLKRMSRKAWSDPQLAGVHLGDYNQGLTRALTEAQGFKNRSEQDGFSA